MPRPIGVCKLVAMVGMQHIAITVRYEPRVDHGTSLAWIAPELGDARLALIRDHLNDPMPSRTWAGPVDGRTFERFANSWGLARKDAGGSASEPGDGKDKASYARTYDGMNWEVGGESPIISVSVQVGPGPRLGRRARHPSARRGEIATGRACPTGVRGPRRELERWARQSAQSVNSRAERAPLPDDVAAARQLHGSRQMPATQSATRRNAAPTLDSDREAYIEVAPGVVLNGRLTLPATTSARGVVAFPIVSRGPLQNPYNRLAVSTLARAGFAALLFDCLTSGEKGSVVPPINQSTVARRLLAATTYLRGQPEVADLRLGYMSTESATAGAMSAAAELPTDLGAVVSIGAAPDLLDVHLEGVTAPVLFIVGGTAEDFACIDRVSIRLLCPNELAMVPGSHKLTEGNPRPFKRAMKLATSWFATHLD